MSTHRYKARTDVGNILGSVRAIRRMADDDEIVREVGEKAEIIFASHALVDTGRMAAGVRAVADGGGIMVRGDARDPETGYDYVGVTRRGHRRPIITPRTRRTGRRGRGRASVIASRRARRHGATAALRTPWGFRNSVRGFRPTSDWVEDAIPEVNDAAQDALESLGRKIAIRWRS